MKMTMRWYGTSDPVRLDYIRQIPGVEGVVTALYDVPVGEAWSKESIARLRDNINSHGMTMEVIESVPVHEDIKLGRATRDKYIDAYITNIERLAEAGVKCICYNFMPVFDWTRTSLDKRADDGSTSLVYYEHELSAMNAEGGTFSLPGWDTSYTSSDMKALFEAYSEVDSERLWSNLEYFLRAIIGVAERCGVVMAIHPDDPPWDIFGLPRIITGEAGIDRLLSLVDSRANGITLCTGSLGASRDNDIVHMVDKYSKRGRIHFMHIRNIRHVEGGFEECAHAMSAGSLDIRGVVRTLVENGYDGYIRPDHGRMIWGETGKPGYGLYDRALGASYINGMIDAYEGERYERE